MNVYFNTTLWIPCTESSAFQDFHISPFVEACLSPENKVNLALLYDVICQIECAGNRALFKEVDLG